MVWELTRLFAKSEFLIECGNLMSAEANQVVVYCLHNQVSTGSRLVSCNSARPEISCQFRTLNNTAEETCPNWS